VGDVRGGFIANSLHGQKVLAQGIATGVEKYVGASK
jgi:hypothetical protein